MSREAYLVANLMSDLFKGLHLQHEQLCLRVLQKACQVLSSCVNLQLAGSG